MVKMEDKIALLEKAVIGFNKELNEIADLMEKSIKVTWAMSTFKRKRKTERIIRHQLSQVLSILKKIDFERLNVSYSETEKLEKGIEYLKKAMNELSWI